MKSPISDIYLSNCPNSENIKPGKEYDEIAKNILIISEEFEKGLSKRQVEEFRKIADLYLDLESLSDDEVYREGFKLGLRVGVETFKE